MKRNFHSYRGSSDAVTLRRPSRRGGIGFCLALATAVCAFVAVVAVAFAGGGSEARTFGADGIATQPLGIHYKHSLFWDVTEERGGLLVATRRNRVETFLPDGSPDPAAPPHKIESSGDVFPIAGGKRLVLDGSKLTRLDADGAVDASFGGTGTIRVESSASDVAELPSGEIVVVGTTYGGTHEVFGAVEFQLIDPDGNVVPGESVTPGGEYGIRRLSVPYVNGGGGVVEITSAPDGGVLVVGDPFLLELRADGSPNPDFGDEGLVKKVPFMVGARVLPDGSVEAVGSSPASPNSLNGDLYVLRLTATGAPDAAFGKDGIRRFDLGGVEEAHAASWAPDDSVVIGGSSQPRGSCYQKKDCREVPILAAFDPSGAPVRDFGRRGVVRMKRLAGTSTNLYGDGVLGLTRRGDGAIVAAGGTGPKGTTAFLAALSPHGGFLRRFGTDGVVRVREPHPASQLFSGLAPLAGGKLLGSGRSDVGITEDAVLVRYDADGGLDRTFGSGSGFVRYGRGRFIDGPAVDGSRRALISIYEPPRSKVLELQTETGSPERRFGGDGLVRMPESVNPVALDFSDDGGAIVAATRDVAGTAEPGLVLRYLPGGMIDRGFGKGGISALRTSGDLEVRVRALLAGVGKPILVGGVSRRHFAVGRLLPNGSPDPGFGTRGWDVMNVAGTPFHLFREGGPNGVAMSRAGSGLYFAGVAQHDGHYRVELFRFDASGRPDRSFGNDGRRVASIAEGAEPTAVVPEPRGVYVALAQGVKPLVFFPFHGRAREEPVGRRPLRVSDVVATTSGRKLVLGWNGSLRAGEESRYHLSERPLASR